jgi:hypothetical protein
MQLEDFRKNHHEELLIIESATPKLRPMQVAKYVENTFFDLALQSLYLIHNSSKHGQSSWQLN